MIARSIIGLDIGTAAVRAAEVRVGRGRPTLLRFGQVALPAGAVIAGEVIDPVAVATALKRLWKEGGFKGKKVVTGVAGARVVARTTELPAMADDDIRSSLPFQVQDLIPIPLHEAVLGHQVIEPVIDPDGGEPRVRVLVAAAHRDVINPLLAALDGAGLEADRIDLIPLALIRTLHEGDFSDLASDDAATAEAIVDIGGGVTNVVVHENGVPRFIRTLSTGGGELTAAIVTGLDVPFEQAETLKRGGGVDVETRYARDVVRSALAPVVEEIRTSLDFWQSQAPDTMLRRVVITGGASLAEDVAERLETALGIPVERARAFTRFDVAKTGLDEQALATAESVGAVAIGLALAGETVGRSTHRIDLVPGSIAEERKARQIVLAAGAGVALFALVLGGLYLQRSGQVNRAKSQAVAAETETASLTQQIAVLHDIEQLETDITVKRQLVRAVLAGDVAYVRLIEQISGALPEDVWLTSVAVSRGDGLTPSEISFTASGSDHTSTARWIQRMSELDALTNIWVSTSTKGQGVNTAQFTATATLTPAAESSRAAVVAGEDEQ